MGFTLVLGFVTLAVAAAAVGIDSARGAGCELARLTLGQDADL
jgi:hypothetical protein